MSIAVSCLLKAWLCVSVATVRIKLKFLRPQRLVRRLVSSADKSDVWRINQTSVASFPFIQGLPWVKAHTMPANRGPLYRWLEGALSNIKRGRATDTGHDHGAEGVQQQPSPGKRPLSYPDAGAGEGTQRPIPTEEKGDGCKKIERSEVRRRTPVKLTEQQKKERALQKKEKIRKAREAYRSGAYRKSFYPETYVKENPIVYNVSPRQRDTTDRSLAQRGNVAGFDPLGFAHELPYSRDLFYLSPYLSCLNCNTIIFVDASKLRSDLAGDIMPQERVIEALPTCMGCQRSDTYLVGADDLASLIRRNKDELIKKIRRERAAARVIQQAYRRSLYIRHGRAHRLALQLHDRMTHRLAAIIASVYRMRLAQRKLRVERDLVDIKMASPIVFRWCLTQANQTSAIKCFWYQQTVLLRQLYEDYWTLLERTGYRPRRYIVEENIHELARRVRWKTAWYATKIEKVWRGILTRRYVAFYKRECCWVREQRVTAAFKAQRAFRGWQGRRYAWGLEREREVKKVQRAFVAEQDKKVDAKSAKQRRVAIMREYLKERQYENTCRLLNRTEPRAHNGRKMIAFAKSMYGGDEVTHAMTACLDGLQMQRDKQAAKEGERVARLEYVRQRKGDDKYLDYYFSEEFRAGRQHFIDELSKKVGYPKSLANRVITEFNAKKGKYQYPPGLNADKRRILHVDFDDMYEDETFA